MTHARSPARPVRAAVFAAVCVLLAGAGHAVTSGDHIPWQALLAAFCLTSAAAWLAAGRRRGVLSIGGGLLAVQGALHLVFDEGRMPRHPDAMRGLPAMSRAAADGAGEALSAQGAGEALAAHGAGVAGHMNHASAPGPMAEGSGAMLAAHLLAAVCCALWLWRGEAAFFRLLRCLDALAFTPLRLLIAAGAWRTAVRRPVRPRPRARSARRPADALLAHVLSRRGPPRRAVFRDTAPIGLPAAAI
ncbi:hypothetical protein [Streptomyces sp. NPDC048639]|uniref:hypothetical protein n=1 Tax=Streptomyces sp. NPDC048639 TaxID=3365581 RepID=UPI00371BAF6D